MPVSPERGIDGARTTDRVSERQEVRQPERLVRPSRQGADSSLFSIDKTRVPRGFVMEWKRHSTMGLEDKHNQVVVRQNHWKPVPHKLQPQILGFMGDADQEQHIIVAGLGLYMRPAYLNEDAEQEQRDETAYTLGQQLESLKLQSRAQVGDRHTKIKRSIIAAQPVE